jgi:hypothetical protein
MRSDIIYDEWIPYIDYEKAECDVKLKDGTIVYHCWPNAGKFNPLCSSTIDFVEEEVVVEIRYRRYYPDNLCKSNCNGDNPKGDRDLKLDSFILNDFVEPFKDDNPGAFIDWKTYSENSVWTNMPLREYTPPYVREEPKIQRNEPCSCGSGKKYKKCCILNILQKQE